MELNQGGRMVFAVPLLRSRVAPRCSTAEELLVVTLSGDQIVGRQVVPLEAGTAEDVVELVSRWNVGTLVCGGVAPELRDGLAECRISVIDNVAGSAEDVTQALKRGTLRPGFGFQPRAAVDGGSQPGTTVESSSRVAIDCLACTHRVCLAGQRCPDDPTSPILELDEDIRRVFEAASDVSMEPERQLCRLAEVVYFGMDMDYRRIGLAFCIDLLSPAAILAGVLRRFFEVVPVCCKISGRGLPEMTGVPTVGPHEQNGTPACNPVGQAEALNRAATDMNVAVGLCVGVDCVFAAKSVAPVTTLFVKDRSLANNPIGAIYSDYYLRESVSPEGAGADRRGHSRRSLENVS
jgi:uncharacterized metal-binding protein/predicted Fe-Mo cluster-binding NifX family protein